MNAHKCGIDAVHRFVYIHCMDTASSTAHPLPPEISAREGDFVRLATDDFDALVIQETRVFKAGNSLAIRIPSAVAKRISLDDGDTVEMAVDRGVIYVRKAPSRMLADLIDRITPQNVHEPLFDEPVGAERW